MRTTRRPYAGRTDAIGFLIDPGHIGPDESARRIATAWLAGATLRHVGRRLLLHLPSPISVRAELAPGLPVEGDRSTVELREGGDIRSVPVGELPAVRLDQIVDLSALTVEYLHPAPLPPAPKVDPMAAPARSAPPPFRDLAGIGKVDARTMRNIESLRRESESDPGVLQRLLGNTSPGRLMSRRNARYVEELSRTFRDRDWDNALRSAIALGGLGGGGWSLRLPRRNRVTGPGVTRTRASSTVGLGENLQQHLRQLYIDAARQLELDGQIMLAAFVHADLLDNPLAAIELIERHGDYRRAAELSEGWLKEPGMTIRLWWRAGDRARAIEVARSRGAFADAVTRLEHVDRPAAAELRAAWVTDLQRAGDHLGAVRAAWPVPDLRPRIIGDLGAIIGGSGRSSGVALAYLLALNAEPTALDSARALLAGDPGPARDAFVAELADHHVVDAAADRELASLGLQSLARGTGELASRTVSRCVRLLQRRADALVVADLPRIAARDINTEAVIRHDLTDHGPVVVFDAVGVSDDHVLVALGERGVRLVTPDGRTRAEWEVPTYSLVVADHQRRALLVAPRGDRFVVHQLDLPIGRPRLLPPLPGQPLPSYDGTRVVLITPDGIEWVEVADGRWKVVWRELTSGEVVHAVERSEHTMAALFSHLGHARAWRWELPGVVLRQSGNVVLPEQPIVLASGNLGTIEQGRGVAKMSWHSVHGDRFNTRDLYPDGELGLLVSGTFFGMMTKTPQVQRIAVHAETWGVELAIADLPPEAHPIFRSTGGLITVGHSAGRVVVLDAERHRTVADIALKD